MYTHVSYRVRSLCLETVLQEGEDPENQKHIHFCSPHDIRALGILSVYNL